MNNLFDFILHAAPICFCEVGSAGGGDRDVGVLAQELQAEEYRGRQRRDGNLAALFAAQVCDLKTLMHPHRRSSIEMDSDA